MRNMNITFEDKEFEDLEKAKKDLTWREFILKGILNQKMEGKKK